MDRTAVTSWLAGYVSAWQANDADLIRPLFSDDAVYRYHPYDEPLVGVEAIVDSWLEEPDDPETWSARYEPVTVDGDVAVAVGTTRYQATSDQSERIYHNCFVLRFDADGRCRELTEWYVRQPA